MDWILTNEGSTLMTKAVTGENLVFTRAETGTGSSSAPAFLTQVIGKQQDLNIDVAHEGSDCKITCLLNNYQVEEGYILKQIGIYAKLADDEDDILAIIGQQIGEQIHPAAEGEAEYEWITLLKVSGTSSITVEGGAGSLALKKDLFAHTNRQDNPHNVTAKDLGLDKVENTSPSDQIPIFGEAENRENIENGDKSSVLWGKVKKWFADLKAAAFAGIANNCTTTEAGSVLDARQGKVLQEEVDAINSNLAVPEGAYVFGGYVKKNTDYGCSVYIPFHRADLYNFTLSSLSFYGYISYSGTPTITKTATGIIINFAPTFTLTSSSTNAISEFATQLNATFNISHNNKQDNNKVNKNRKNANNKANVMLI